MVQGLIRGVKNIWDSSKGGHGRGARKCGFD